MSHLIDIISIRECDNVDTAADDNDDDRRDDNFEWDTCVVPHTITQKFDADSESPSSWLHSTPISEATHRRRNSIVAFFVDGVRNPKSMPEVFA